MESIKHFLKIEYSKIHLISILIAVFFFCTAIVLGFKIEMDFSNVVFDKTILDVFLNNLFICLVFIISGISLGIVSIILLSINGVYLGSALNYYMGQNGIEKTLFKIIPHAIFEIPAIILSSSIGFLILTLLIYKAHNKPVLIKQHITYIVKITILVIILLLIAAIIEVNISAKF